jgi:hypothetical protein
MKENLIHKKLYKRRRESGAVHGTSRAREKHFSISKICFLFHRNFLFQEII